MRNQFFKFKQFSVNQDNCAMKVGTDGVLLGAWCDVEKAKKVLDVGTGTGLIALMIAQRTDCALIDAVEIDKLAYMQASQNFQDSRWSGRIGAINLDFNQYVDECNIKYDLIVSNPPYFENSLKSSNLERTMARHTDSLSFDELLQGASMLLNESGIISLIVPYAVENRLDEIADSNGLRCSRKTYIKGNSEASIKRMLVEYTKAGYESQPIIDELIVELDRNIYTEQYIALTKEFYLKM